MREKLSASSVVMSLALMAVSAIPLVAVSARQTQTSTPPTAASFEVTSVKRNDSGVGGGSNRNQPNGSFTGTNVTLRPFIARAYEMQVSQVTGGPDWIDFDRFDIVGRGPEGTPTTMR